MPEYRLVEAAKDYFYLLERGYRKEYALRFVADHYKLERSDRLILYRSIHPSSHIEKISGKVISDLVNVKNLYVDYYNVVITIMEIIDGNLIYRGNDGFIRDMAGIHGKIRDVGKLVDATKILFDELSRYNIDNIHLFLEAQISKSGELSRYIKDKFNVDVTLTRKVDNALLKVEDVIATSDSVLHSKAIKIVDLPYFVAKNISMKIDIIDFKKIL
jgi:hypothetical protein